MRFPSRHPGSLPEGFEDAVRTEFLKAPPAEVERVHIARIAAASDEAARTAAPRPTPSVTALKPGRHGRISRAATVARLAAATGAAVLAVPMALTGLAFAGVPLPQPAAETFEALGIELPNQDDETDSKRGADPELARQRGEERRSEKAPGSEAKGRADGRGKGAKVTGEKGGANVDPPATGPPANAQGQGHARPPHAQDGVGGPPPHARDGAGTPPPHSQGSSSGSSKAVPELPPQAQSGPASRPDHARGGGPPAHAHGISPTRTGTRP